MDQTEVRNLDYLEYLYWLNHVYGTDYPGVYRKALPDTLVWRDKLAYNEPLVEYYFRHPAYRNYPVVGVSWVQASDYCAWRTDRVNENLLIRKGILAMDPSQKDENNFNTESYLAGQYEGLVNKPLPDLNPNGTGTRKVRWKTDSCFQNTGSRPKQNGNLPHSDSSEIPSTKEWLNGKIIPGTVVMYVPANPGITVVSWITSAGLKATIWVLQAT